MARRRAPVPERVRASAPGKLLQLFPALSPPFAHP
jgi:hypothetical protein